MEMILNGVRATLTRTRVEWLLEELKIQEQEFNKILSTTGWDIDETIDNLTSFISGSAGVSYSYEDIVNGIKRTGLFEKLSNNLSNLNTMRGGTKGFKGFVFEELHAVDATLKGQITEVINNNGIPDFAIKNSDGSISYAQSKAGYNGQNIDFSPYDGQTIIVDNGNKYLINKAKEAGLDVIESDISLKESAKLAKKMQLESKITGNKNSIIVPKTHAALNVAKEVHHAGIKTAAKGCQFGGGFSLGSNIVDVVSGDKDLDEAVVDIVKDSAVSAGVGYVTGATVTAVGNTAIGAAVGGAVSTAGTAIASTAVGGTVVAAGTTVAGTITAAGTAVGAAVTGTMTAAGTAVAGTTVGGAVIAAGSAVGGTIAAAGTAVASTAVGGAAVAAGTAVIGAAVAAAPVVAVGTVLGIGFKVAKKIFRK
ncbi:hypothetical protein [Tissierella sp.]|uniref:hypothetical protein n=1 Tax=Tissierella sp. TaxID=41274 RepID=UPI00303CF7CF